MRVGINGLTWALVVGVVIGLALTPDGQAAGLPIGSAELIARLAKSTAVAA